MLQFSIKKKTVVILAVMMVVVLFLSVGGIRIYQLITMPAGVGLSSFDDCDMIARLYAERLSEEEIQTYQVASEWLYQSERLPAMKDGQWYAASVYNFPYEQVWKMNTGDYLNRWYESAYAVDHGRVYHLEDGTEIANGFYRAYLMQVHKYYLFDQNIEITGTCPENLVQLCYLKTEYVSWNGQLEKTCIPLSSENGKIDLTIDTITKDGLLKSASVFLVENEDEQQRFSYRYRYGGANASL